MDKGKLGAARRFRESQGYLRAAFRPTDEVCVVRAVARQRDVLLAEQASWVQRMQKARVQMNIQLTEVLTDVMGMTGQAIIRAIVAGERDPKVSAALCRFQWNLTSYCASHCLRPDPRRGGINSVNRP